MDTSAFVILSGGRQAAKRNKQTLNGTVRLSQEQLDMINQAIKDEKQIKVSIAIED